MTAKQSGEKCPYCKQESHELKGFCGFAFTEDELGINEPRVYIVRNDHTDQSKHVVAKNRNDAKTKVNFPFTHVAWRPWIKFIDGKFIDKWGKEYL
jgi:hypothetical protein